MLDGMLRLSAVVMVLVFVVLLAALTVFVVVDLIHEIKEDKHE